MIRSTIQQIVADRVMMLLCIGIFLGGVGYMAYVAFNLSPSDLQLAIRYTSYGETHFYRDKWWYLIGFVLFGLLFILAHLSMMAKLYVTGMKQLAYSFGWLSIVVLVLMFVYTYATLSIAYLN